MKKLILFLFGTFALAHPVPYSIDLIATYDDNTHEASIICKSDSRNKCGLHDFDLFDEKSQKIITGKFPFLKDKTTLKCTKKPKKMVFYLRKIPEHQYIIYFE